MYRTPAGDCMVRVEEGVVSDDRMTEFIMRLRNEADSADFWDLARAAVPRPAPPGVLGRLRTRAAAALAAAFVTVGGLGGVAYAANGATPGDFLYGLDRALEAVGIGNGGASERIAEAIVLVEEGATGHGLAHAAKVVPDEAGNAAVLTAADAVGPDVDTEVYDEVLALLTYLSDNVGHIDGPTVAEYARAINGNQGGGPGSPIGPPDGVPVGPPDATPVGPPEETPVGPPVEPPVGGTTTTTTTVP
jgi:hypothetical protein